MDAAQIVNQMLKIPDKYMKNCSQQDRVEAIVHRSWLREVEYHNVLPDQFVLHDQLSPTEVEARFKQGENLGPAWAHLLLVVVWKHDAPVIPLPRTKTGGKMDLILSYYQVMHYVSQTNHKNLWKEAFKKYSNSIYTSRYPDQSTIQLTDSSGVLRDVISRAYGCPIQSLDGRIGPSPHSHTIHPNLLPCQFALEDSKCFILVHEGVPSHTLQDCAMFSPAAMGCNSKSQFLVFQLLCLLRHVHEQGLVLGGITLADIHIDSHLWIQAIPKLAANQYSLPLPPAEPKENVKVAASSNSDIERKLSELTLAWVRGAVNNLDYLTAINKLAGRRFGDPRCHHVVPWVTDFSSPSGANWRDLTKSKFRLNKGDRQLDLTYDLPCGSNTAQVPHHISDVLSEITYYVYLSRVTPCSVLCRYVRPHWVPAEYPSSIQRLQQWTPDECIPEFFTDPSVFKSIHPDLPDLEIPYWASSAEQLVAHHRAALESSYVSDRLHHWIDLTFGYKLSGQAAVKSKNVCLQLVDGHTEVINCGVVQLFTYPHPPRASPSPYLGITPPRLHHHHHRSANKGSDEEEGPSSGGEDSVANSSSHSSPLGLTRLLSRSRGSLQTSGSSPGDKQSTIPLPHDYNPVALLNAVEALYGFTGTGPAEVGGSPGKTALCKQVVAACRQQEMQVLGCLIVEMFLSSKVRLLGQMPNLSERLTVCRSVFAANRDSVPRCFRSLVSLLLDDSDSEVPVTSCGTPPPSAHQLLQPALSSSLMPMNPTLPYVYHLGSALRKHTAAVTVLQALRVTHPHKEDTILTCIHELSQQKVESVARDLQPLSEHPLFCVDLIMSHILVLLADPDTAISTAWYLFDPIAKVLGPADSAKVLLEPMVRLYDCDHSLSPPAQLKKRIKLYHRSFLLQLMVRFRLKMFLDHFITPLVEAVGGYHDVDLLLPAHHNDSSEVEEAECASMLSPMDEDSSADSEKTPVVADSNNDPQQVLPNTNNEKEPEVFVLETEEVDQQQQIASLLLDMQTDDGDVAEGVAPEQTERSDVESVASTEDQQPLTTTEYNKVSEVGVASVQWLSHRLGPVLTATYLSRNLLRMLSLCYTQHGCTQQSGAKLLGDENAASVLQCLSDIVGLYGEQFVVVQYLPATADVISLSKKLTSSLEAAVVAHLTLLTHCLPLLSDNTLHQLFQEVILSRVCGPALRLAATLRQVFPGGVAARRALMLKLVQCLHVLMLRATTEQKITLVHTMAKFFSVFSKARGYSDDSRIDDPVSKVRDSDYVGSFSPPKSSSADVDVKTKAQEELAAVMSPELAHWSYGPFASFFGEPLMEQSLKNHALVRQLCDEHRLSHSTMSDSQMTDCAGDSDVEDSVGSFGTNVVVIGNRIDLHEPAAKSASPNPGLEDSTDTSRKADNNTRHLRGNWLSYWQHEVGNTSPQLDIKQIKLLSFSGHCNSVRSLAVLDNENSFLSASRDKTVKVWSLRSMGDGSTIVPAQWTYTGHRKSVMSVGFCETARLAVSCDSTVHVWDPYVGRVLTNIDPSRSPPVNTLRALPPPSYLVMAATTDPTLRTLDTRVGGYVYELKVASSGAGLVRCIAVPPSATWVALGQASGLLTVIDLRTGAILATWRGHDGEVLQLVAASDTTLVSSSLDQAVSVWNPSEGKLKFNIKGPTEPVHCLDLYGTQLVSGTTANRLGVHGSIDPVATFSSSRLRSDSFRGVLTTLQVLPLNRLLLLGADTGGITLIC